MEYFERGGEQILPQLCEQFIIVAPIFELQLRISYPHENVSHL